MYTSSAYIYTLTFAVSKVHIYIHTRTMQVLVNLPERLTKPHDKQIAMLISEARDALTRRN